MPVVADVDADFGEAKVENRIPQIPRTKIEFLPEPRRNMRNVCFAVFPEVRTVALNYSCCVVINAFALNFVDWNDERNPQFRCEFAQELDGRSVRNALGEIVPTNRLLGAKVRTIENFLQAHDFRACLAAWRIIATCLSIIASLIFSSELSGDSKFLAWINEQL